MLFNNIGAGTQPKMKGITQQDFCSGGMNIPRQHPLYRAIGTNRHKCRRFHRASWKSQPATSGMTVITKTFELHAALTAHWESSVAGVINMASP